LPGSDRKSFPNFLSEAFPFLLEESQHKADKKHESFSHLQPLKKKREIFNK